MTSHEATERQNKAADPENSTWLSANAGSGKTSVLTSRVARLLLMGVLPERILCLTYTKTAATEMQNRLFQRLGAWALKDDTSLMAELQTLGLEGRQPKTTLSQARTAFARAIETPGGLKIQTIHAFCAGLLRRFPLEAQVSPRFIEIDERSAQLLRESVIDEIAAEEPETFDGVARLHSGQDFESLCDDIARRREGFEDRVSESDVLGWFGLPPNRSLEKPRSQCLSKEDLALLKQLSSALAEGTVNDLKALKLLSAVLAEPMDQRAGTNLEDVLLVKSGDRIGKAKVGTFPTKATRSKLDASLLDDLMLRVEAAREERLATMAARNTLALHRFARCYLGRYAEQKRARGWLDFDDLIFGARRLLMDRSVAQWVLYRLDGGIDHILVDEGQDTNPTQWDLIRLLSQDFTSGEGARPGTHRTVFVVGDPKQSIYSFQGADPAAFGAMKTHFEDSLSEAGSTLQDLRLEYSFRSSEAILRVVDQTFPPGRADALGGDSCHRAFDAQRPGRVDLWPAVEAKRTRDPERWYDPMDLPGEEDHRRLLAQKIATAIAEMVASGSVPDKTGGMRRIVPADILILLQRRSALFHEIIRACKEAGLPIAGADRLRMGGEMAVRDLLALLSFLATPEDSLSLAAALRSPLMGWSEAELFELAHHRAGEHLWPALRRNHEENATTLALLNDLRDTTDFLRPHELLERILVRHDGRRNLIARLGSEAEDGIDALLAQALEYESASIPSLTGFLEWLQADRVEIKRQPDSSGNNIRVMTVHGAKGLEAPILILPETEMRRHRDPGPLLQLATGGLVWRESTGSRTPVHEEALALERLASERERLRLLYVAATRAECWLIIAAAGEVGNGADSWYSSLKEGMLSLGAASHSFGDEQGLRYQLGHWPEADAPATGKPMLPPEFVPNAKVLDRPFKRVMEEPRAPSDLGGLKFIGGGEGLPEQEAKLHGVRVHRLIEMLPAVPVQHRATAVQQILPDADASARTESLKEALRVMSEPSLAILFGPHALAEVPISAEVSGLGRLNGTIDRLLVDKSMVLAVDFKTNANVPVKPSETPEGLLRQMGAYLTMLEQIYTDRNVEVAIVWTRSAQLMKMPNDIVRAALARAATS